MDGQMTLAECMSSVTYDRWGRQYPTPAWMDRERCELCGHWERLPVDDQPPSGWGVMGQCDAIHHPEQKGYIRCSKSDYCDMYEGRYE